MSIKNKLYNGEVELTFDSFKHKYTVRVVPEYRTAGDPEDGTEIQSVTKFLGVINKPALVNWSARVTAEHIQGAIEPGVSYDEVQLQAIFEGAKNAHWQKKVDAGNIGTFVHNWIEKYINGENPGMPVNEALQDSINNFLGWVKKHDVKFVLSEQPIYSRKYHYAGTLDFICTIDGKLYIGDTKTSSGIYPEYWLQTSSYRYARVEEFPKEEYMGQIIIRISRDGTFEVAILRDTNLYQEMFLAFLSAKRLQETLVKVDAFKPERE